MRNDSAVILDDLLARWHSWMSGTPINGIDRLEDPAFRNARSRSGWDSSSDVIDRELDSTTMKKIDFQVGGDSRAQGGMTEPHRSAIYHLARNCCTGQKVWDTPRLPSNPIERAAIVQEAREILTQRLIAVGVL